MAYFFQAIKKVFDWEGGYSDDTFDRGGKTKFGISQKAYPALDIENLTQKQAQGIYKEDYWDQINGDELNNQAIAEMIFDAAVNVGVLNASFWAQFSSDTWPVDGKIGPETTKSLNMILNPHDFMNAYTIFRLKYYARICDGHNDQKRFLLGWMNRALSYITTEKG